MEYVSVDIETTGLDRENDQVIEIGAIIENTHNPLPFNEIPKFHAIVRHNRYTGTPIAINMNQRIFKILADREYLSDSDKIQYDIKYNIVKADEVAQHFYYWCVKHLQNKPKDFPHNPVTSNVAGKNYLDFDKRFLEKLPEWNKYFSFQRRTLDPAILFTNFMEDTKLPDLSKCLQRAGIEDNVVTHEAVKDAWQVIQVLRTKYGVL